MARRETKAEERARIENLIVLAKRAYEKAFIVDESAEHVFIRTPGGFYWTEIRMLRGGALIVHGDIQHVLFGYNPDAGSIRGMLDWLREDIGSSYVEEKAAIGSRFKIDFARLAYAHAAVLKARELFIAREPQA